MTQRTHIHLTGEKSERFEEIYGELCEEFGYEITRPEAVGMLMREFRADD